MRYFENESDGHQVVEYLKQKGYIHANYFSGENYDNLTIGSSPNRYVNLSFDKHRGFYMNLTGTWVEEVEKMKQVEEEARKVTNLICELHTIAKK